MTKPTVTGDIGERDVATAVESLSSASFKTRIIRTDCNVPDPEWKAPGGQSIPDKVREQMKAFKKDLDGVRFTNTTAASFTSLTPPRC